MGLSLLQDRAPPLPYLPLPSLPPPPPPPTAAAAQASSAATNNWDNRISPTILLIIAILAIFFFLSGLLHLLIRYLLRPPPPPRDLPDDTDAATTALQGPLQQLFHLHDAGVDQSFIDALPVFLYGAIVGGGNKDPFDCAICLCEFEPEDKLRLLPKCSHAFHLECIDTWLLSHSTCPLCRGSLLPPEFSTAGSWVTPLVLVLQSAGESSRDIVPSDSVANSHPDHLGEDDLAASTNTQPKVGEREHREELQQPPTVLPPATAPAPPVAIEAPEAKVVAVKLGKFRNMEPGAPEGSSTSGGGTATIDGRRCFSMGSFAYVMDDTTLLQVAIEPPSKNNPGGAAGKPSRRLAMSECDCHSKRDGFDPPLVRGGATSSTRGHQPTKKESFSFSKTWLRSKKDRPPPPSVDSDEAFSFHLPPVMGAGGERGGSSKLGSEFDSESEYGFDVEGGSCSRRAVGRGEEMQSFARRTMLWVMGRNHKIVNHI